MNHVAIDLHDSYSQICVMTPERQIVMEGRIPTTRDAFVEFFRQRAASRVVYEAGPHALWVGEVLRDLGHDPVACHARRIRLIAESRNKNDRVDAEFLVRLSLSDLDLMRPIQQRSRQTLDERSVTTVRASLVDTRKRLRTTLRGLVKPFGVRLASGKRRAIAEAGSVDLPPGVRAAVDGLLEVLATTERQIRAFDETVRRLAESRETQRMRTIPGIGPLVSLAFKHAIEDPHRFAPEDVGAYLGLTPANRSSAGKKLTPKERGRPGDPYVRSLLIQAAWTLHNSRSDSDLARWSRTKVQEIGSSKGIVATARKLAVLMHHLWIHDEDFIAHPRRSH